MTARDEADERACQIIRDSGHIWSGAGDMFACRGLLGDALISAREAGRVEGLEEAAKMVAIDWNEFAADDIRALKTGARP